VPNEPRPLIVSAGGRRVQRDVRRPATALRNQEPAMAPYNLSAATLNFARILYENTESSDSSHNRS